MIVNIIQESSASELWHRYEALTASLSQDLCIHVLTYMYTIVYIIQESSASELWHRYEALTASLSQDLCILTYMYMIVYIIQESSSSLSQDLCIHVLTCI